MSLETHAPEVAIAKELSIMDDTAPPAFSMSSESDAGSDAAPEPPPTRRRARKSRVAVADKDSEEEELERLVLGSGSRWRRRLLDDELLHLDACSDAGALQLVEVEGEEDGDLADVDDADLFVIDTIGDASKSSLHTAAPLVDPAPTPAWVDSDDDRVSVSLASANRLRKLRVTAAEDVVSGAEYCRRLRQLFLRLNPQPEWVLPRRKRRSRAAPGDDAPSDASSLSDEGGGIPSDDIDDDADLSTQPLSRFLRNATALVTASQAAGKRRRLRPETIDIRRTREIPTTLRGAVSSLSFHPTEPILLSSSPASVMYLHRIDPSAHPIPNPELLSVQAQRVDVRRAQFVGPHGDRIYFAGRRSYIHDWNLQTGLVRKTSRVLGHDHREHKSMASFRASPCGRWLAVLSSSSSRHGGGAISILNAATMQWVASARLGSHRGVADFAWWRSSAGLTILGRDGRVGEWSMADRAFNTLWRDHGCVGAIVLALGGSDGPLHMGGHRWVAIGSSAGITNLYDRRQIFATPPGPATGQDLRPSPVRVFGQLITPITTLVFSPDGQLLAFASEHQKDALRLVHLPTCTVYRNWPTSQTPMGRIASVAFAAHDSLLAIGNKAGKIRLWEIRG